MSSVTASATGTPAWPSVADEVDDGGGPAECPIRMTGRVLPLLYSSAISSASRRRARVIVDFGADAALLDLGGQLIEPEREHIHEAAQQIDFRAAFRCRKGRAGHRHDECRTSLPEGLRLAASVTKRCSRRRIHRLHCHSLHVVLTPVCLSILAWARFGLNARAVLATDVAVVAGLRGPERPAACTNMPQNDRMHGIDLVDR